MPRKKTHRHEAAFDAALADNLIELLQNFRRSQMLRSEAAQNSHGSRTIERGSASLSADVAERDAKFSRVVWHKVVEIAAQLARGNDARGNVQAILAARNRRQQRGLQTARGVEVALHARFIARHLFIKARIFNRDGEMRCENRKRLHVIRREIIELRTFEIEHADHTMLVKKRNRQLRTRFRI